MARSILRTKTLDFAVEINKLAKELMEKNEYVIANQIGRSGTSIGANVYEAQYAQSKADFVSKLQIALKETSETGYWLTLLKSAGAISDNQHAALTQTWSDIRAMLVSSLKTAKNNGQ